jgi:hypothetical protein
VYKHRGTRASNRADILAFQVREFGDAFAPVGDDAVCDFADDVDEANIAMICILLQTLGFGIGGQVEVFGAGSEVCNTAGY